MAYWITIFNQVPVGEISTSVLLTAINKSNLETLCKQYDLDPDLIEPALAHFEVISAATAQPIMVIKYQQGGEKPIVVYRWDAASQAGDSYLRKVMHEVSNQAVEQHLQKTQVVYGLELEQSHLADMGLLIAYEIARWLAQQGKGVILGLDNAWYHLNQHMAFIPIKPDKDPG